MINQKSMYKGVHAKVRQVLESCDLTNSMSCCTPHTKFKFKASSHNYVSNTQKLKGF